MAISRPRGCLEDAMPKRGGGVCGSICPWLWRGRVESADEAGRENRSQTMCFPLVAWLIEMGKNLWEVWWLKRWISTDCLIDWSGKKPTRGLVIEETDERFGDWSGEYPRIAWLIEMGKSPREVWWLKWCISTNCLIDWNGKKPTRGLVLFLRFPNAAKSWWQLDPLAVIQKYLFNSPEVQQQNSSDLSNTVCYVQYSFQCGAMSFSIFSCYCVFLRFKKQLTKRPESLALIYFLVFVQLVQQILIWYKGPLKGTVSRNDYFLEIKKVQYTLYRSA